MILSPLFPHRSPSAPRARATLQGRLAAAQRRYAEAGAEIDELEAQIAALEDEER